MSLKPVAATTTKESVMASGEDYRKYLCAMGSRSVRRVGAEGIDALREIDWDDEEEDR